MIPIDLHGKTALVTGAGGELGRVMARTLAEAGADVILHGFSHMERTERIAREIGEDTGVRTFAARADVGDLDSVLAMKKEIEERFTLPDIVVTAAVAQYAWKELLDQPVEDYESQFRTCVLQNVHMAKAFVPHMKERGYGRIVGINTECAMRCGVTESAYDSGKRGMDGIMRVLAKEVGPFGITVNQVAPGWTVSEKDRLAHTERAPAYEAGVPLGRRGTDREIANAVLFLASDLASFITGVYLPVCGGAEMPAI